jgi:hypothetical protein
MDPAYIKNTKGPLTNYLRSRNNKKKQSNSIMSTSLPRIRVVNDDTDRNTVTIKNPVSLDKIDIMSDSSSSIKSIPRQTTKKPPVQKPAAKSKSVSMPRASFDSSELQYFVNNQKHKPVVERRGGEEDEESIEEESVDDQSVQDYGDYYNEEDEYYDDEESTQPRVNNKELEKRKRELLVKLLALENKGVELTKKFSLRSKYEDIEFEYETQKKALETEAGVKFQQKALMAFVTGLEFMNNKFDPVGAKLDGWSESVMDSIGDYDTVFRKLYEKYSTRAELPPELELLMTLVASGFMFHLTNSFFKSSMPVVNNMMQNNPDIMKNIAEAMNRSGLQSGNVPGEMSGPSLDLSSLIGGNAFNKVGPPPPANTSKEKEKEVDRFSVASSDDSMPISTISKSGKKTININ